MQIGIVGKTNTGKSSFFKAATLIDVEISSRIFCTINPNIGVGYLTAPCPCKELKLKCSPQNSKCENGTRLIPVKLLDVAGLVPGAHEGRGLGNKFLNDLTPADVLINVIDISGTTDSEGNISSGYDPIQEVKFLENEINLWFADIIKRNLQKIKEPKKAVEILAGLGIKPAHTEQVIEEHDISKLMNEKSQEAQGLQILAMELRKLSKPIVIAANKIDLPDSEKNFEKVKQEFPNLTIIPCCAEAEIALRGAARSGLIKYLPGESNFEILDSDKLSDKQKKALEFIRENVLKKFGTTGVQECLNKAVFEFLEYIAVYPVENENKFSDKKGNILPHVFLLPKGSTAMGLAEKVHTDIAKNFIGAVDARTKKRISAETILKNGDIISIQSAAR